MSGLDFEWDPVKAAHNLAKHRVPFEEALTVFGNPFALTIPDPGHSQNERRFVTFGRSARQRLLVVVHTERAGTVRIISARPATPKEKRHHGSQN